MGKLGLVLFAAIACTVQAVAAEPALVLSRGGVTHSFTASELLARPDATDLTVADDVSYRRAASYRAVPLLALLSELPSDSRSDTLEARATDGFVAQIPLALVERAGEGGAVPWIAVEPPGQPWPDLPGKTQGAGPFYLVWQNPERSSVGREQWPYQLADLAVVESLAHRWPQLAVDAALPPDAPARRGAAVFAANCLPCHKLNGGGAGVMGPDLGSPANVSDYLTERGLRAIVRDPRAVRTWPLQQMPGFGPELIGDADLDALVAYLRQSVRRP
ncbi:MAG: cytochrome c [Acetobacteraceae bacterium]|nr:cytochrome c [Acetobacteraceae bacterium]